MSVLSNVATVWSMAHTSSWKTNDWPYTADDFYPGDEYRLKSQDVTFMDINAEQFIEKLYCTTRDKLFRYAYRLIGRVEKAEELVQEVFVLAMLHKEELLSHANPQGWLFVTLK